MKRCKYAGDVEDEYCKSCDGIKMMVDGIEKSCSDCAGYEPGDEDVETEEDIAEEETSKIMTPPVKEEPKKPIKNTQNKAQNSKKTEKAVNTTPKTEKSKIEANNTVTEGVIQVVSTEKTVEEDKEFVGTEIKVTSLRYTSSATVKKGDNYYKFTAEEEWSTSFYNGDIQDVREQLWAKLNGEVDKQIEDLQNM